MTTFPSPRPVEDLLQHRSCHGLHVTSQIKMKPLSASDSRRRGFRANSKVEVEELRYHAAPDMVSGALG